MKKRNLEGLKGIISRGDYGVAIAIIGAITALMIPLPTWLIDILLTFNIAIAMVILLVSMFIQKPLEFSVFPALLLFTTIFRLSLNVATTRKILLEAYAGSVIEAFGGFVVGGNYIVGAVIFLILVAIQFMVITKGATRIAEVAARFTLDAMPGKQMSIDADLNSGLITEDEARERREDIRREADFYGAMDGAAKFVRGDVGAGLVITFINVLGGFGIGVLQRGMEFTQALQTYTLLTIGDGLVAQIPSMVIATASGIIVTRAGASEDSLGTDLVSQVLIQPKALGIASVVIGLSAFVPGLPTIPFLMVSALAGGFTLTINSIMEKEEKKEVQKKQEEEQKARLGPEPVADLLQIDPMELEIGYAVIPIVDPEQGGDLLERISSMRKRFALDLGLVVPPIRIRDNMQLAPEKYAIKIKGEVVAEGAVFVDHFMAMNSGSAREDLPGTKTIEPAFGLPAFWITEGEKEKAEQLGYTVVDASTVLATHLSELIRKHAHELLNRQDVKEILDRFKEKYPTIVEELVPSKMSIGEVQRVLQNLLKENISIRNLVTILETLGDYSTSIKDPDILTEYVRSSLRVTISKKFAQSGKTIYAVTVAPTLEQYILQSIQKSEHGASLVVEPGIAQAIYQRIAEIYNAQVAKGISPVILCSPLIRMYFKRLIEKKFPDIDVVSFNEIIPEMTVENVGVIDLKGENKTSK
ncbi:MAG: flagellar biosynthesis protein FlhA [Candidatus Aureabacteria bacterium]|nr:flagellar biosynthesis protein FlhA [Candidatus Auribacterota bacterium]